jgi:hypothetical protein
MAGPEDTDDINAQFNCTSSLIFLTHPTVLKEFAKLAKQPLITIHTQEGAMIWASTDGSGKGPFIKSDIGIKRFMLVFKGPVIESDFAPGILAKNWGASITRIKRPGPPPSSKRGEMYQEPPVVIVPEDAPDGRPFKPDPRSFRGSKRAGDVYVSKSNSGKLVADYTLPGGEQRRVLGNSQSEIVDVARENVKDTISATLTVSIEQLNHRISDLERSGSPEEKKELKALLKKRQEMNKLMATFTK